MYPGGGDVESAVHLALSSLDLHSLTTDQLKQLLNDDDQLAERLGQLDGVKSLRERRDHRLASNRSLAEHNVSQQPRLQQLKEQLRQLLTNNEQLQQELRTKQDKLSVTDQPLDTTLALLQTAYAEAEEESENLVQSMLGGEMTVDNFLELYLSKRCTAISRRIKVDKLKELVRAPVSGYRPPAPPPAAPAPYPPSVSVPYSVPAVPYPAAGASGPYPAVPYPPAAGPYPPAAGPYPAAALPYPPYMPQPRY